LSDVFVDAHAHLDMFEEPSLNEELQRAAQAGVALVITNAMDVPSSHDSLAIAERYPSVYAAVGIHPWLATAWTPEMAEQLRALAASPRVVALGEIGLDYGDRNRDREMQQQVFRALIALAREMGKPVVVHSRQAAEDTVRLLREEHAEQIGGQIHEFTPDDGFIDACLELGFYVDAGRSLLMCRSDTPQLESIVRRVPLDRLLLETDAAPVYDSGHKVAPADVTAVAATVGRLKKISEGGVGAAALANAQRLFRIA